MTENLWVLSMTLVAGVGYAALIGWYRHANTDGEIPPLSVTAGCSLVAIAFIALRGWEEGLWLLVVLALLGGPQVLAWQLDWLARRRDDAERDRRELR